MATRVSSPAIAGRGDSARASSLDEAGRDDLRATVGMVGRGGFRATATTLLRDRCLLVAGVAWTAVSLLAFGLVSAIIPNAVFGRQVPPEPFAIWTWVASAPLMGLIAATYTAPMSASGGPAGRTAGQARPLTMAPAGDATTDAAKSADERGSLLGTLGSLGAFLAIGCPVCNKIALLALGASGAMTIWAPIQPFVGAASMALLAGTLVWRLRVRARGGACSV